MAHGLITDSFSEKQLLVALGTSDELLPDGQHFAGAVVREEYIEGILIADANGRNIFSRSDRAVSKSVRPQMFSPRYATQ
ncbi:MAG: hypothetical protein B6D41_02800 [Chloroflexi bacterium UTCFX4]|jgi:hypothetical protein|nr:MAG: hypothetical protein B6D41_02800 [Chloroflexi bacterium UTCFX4]